MKKLGLVLFSILLLVSIGLAGCQQSEQEESSGGENGELTDDPTITGEIVEIEDGRFLVESTSEKLSDGRPDAIWFSTEDIESLKLGQTVSVWTTAVDESYPGQAMAEKIEIEE